mmetsp:Transcript_22660/g.89933  ORF Transcript_22660/g.89933 Transcript_22660/m.89933 type:complete len:125 (+) Transcript_22660:464-838(+)
MCCCCYTNVELHFVLPSQAKSAVLEVEVDPRTLRVALHEALGATYLTLAAPDKSLELHVDVAAASYATVAASVTSPHTHLVAKIFDAADTILCTLTLADEPSEGYAASLLRDSFPGGGARIAPS